MKRLALREYLPWSALTISWVLMVAFSGAEAAMNLAAALMLVGAARSLTYVSTRRLLRSARAAEASASSLVLHARAISIGAAFAGLLLTGLFYVIVTAAHRPMLGQMLLLLSIGLPARYFVAFAGRRRRRIAKFRLASGFSGLFLVGLAVSAGWGWHGAALAFALRDWMGLAVLVGSRSSQPSEETVRAASAPSNAWSTMIAANQNRAKRRLAMRLSRALLGPFLGPFGSLAARTARGAGLGRRIERFVPQGKTGLLVASFVLSSSGLVLLLASPRFGLAS
jgi:hypothetical protein